MTGEIYIVPDSVKRTESSKIDNFARSIAKYYNGIKWLPKERDSTKNVVIKILTGYDYEIPSLNKGDRLVSILLDVNEYTIKAVSKSNAVLVFGEHTKSMLSAVGVYVKTIVVPCFPRSRTYIPPVMDFVWVGGDWNSGDSNNIIELVMNSNIPSTVPVYLNTVYPSSVSSEVTLSKRLEHIKGALSSRWATTIHTAPLKFNEMVYTMQRAKYNILWKDAPSIDDIRSAIVDKKLVSYGESSMLSYALSGDGGVYTLDGVNYLTKEIKDFDYMDFKKILKDVVDAETKYLY